MLDEGKPLVLDVLWISTARTLLSFFKPGSFWIAWIWIEK